jgi:hypothetical protein
MEISNLFPFGPTQGLTAVTPKTEFHQTAMGLLSDTSTVSLIAVILLKCRRLGGISEMPLLPFGDKRSVVCMYFELQFFLRILVCCRHNVPGKSISSIC